MKPMLDNDIDNLFKSSFEDYEVTPSKESWNKVKASLNDKPVKNNRPLWLAAASIIVIFGLAIKFFGTNNKVIKLHGSSENTDEEIVAYSEVEKPVSVKNLPKKMTLEEVKLANEKHFLSLVSNSAPLKGTNKKKRKSIIENDLAIDKNKSDNDILSRSLSNQILAENNLVDVIQSNESVIAQRNDLESTLDKENHLSTEKSKIKSVGDLFNFVIAKVDNREQKLLHFSKTEESDMELTQINLGLFKYKKN